MGRLYFTVRLAETGRLPQGPLKTSAVLDSLKGGLLAWTDLAWSPHDGGPWRRLYEILDFHSILPPIPPDEQIQKWTSHCAGQLQAQSPSSTSAVGTLKPPLYLHVLGSEHGPFNLSEIRDLIQKAKFQDQVYVWCKTLPYWVPMERVAELADLRVVSSQAIQTPHDVFAQAVQPNQEGRTSIREGIVATFKMRFTGLQHSAFGVGIDISATGAQVRLEAPIGIQKGDELRFEMIPLSLLRLPNLIGSARVAWYRPETLCAGLEFVEFERDGWERLKSHIR
jgi:hypothetical protein